VRLKTRARNCGTPEVASEAVLRVFMYILVLLASAFWETTQRVITVTLQLEILSPNFTKMKSVYCNIRPYWANYVYPKLIAPYSSVCAITGVIYRARRCEEAPLSASRTKRAKIYISDLQHVASGCSTSWWKDIRDGNLCCRHHNQASYYALNCCHRLRLCSRWLRCFGC